MEPRPPQHSPRYLALLQVLRTADALWDASRSFFQRWDLTPSQFNVLNLLYGKVGGRSQTDLSLELIVHRSNVTGLVDRLEKLGLVQRKDAAGDRRAYRVSLTRKGERMMARILPPYYAAAERAWGALPSRRIRQIQRDLELAARNSQQIAQNLAATQTREALDENLESNP